jgi:ribonuclease HI
VTDDPSQPPRFRTHIPESRDQSIEAEKKDNADFKIFTDGSNHDGGVGAAAVLYKRDYPRPVKHLKAHLGDPDEHGSYEAEAVGGILAMQLIETSPDTYRKKVSIYIDNQAIVKASVRPKASSGQHLLYELSTRANNSQAAIDIRWISSHSGVPGNKKADKLAKEAAEGRASRRADLPSLLRKPLPVNASSSKQHYLASLKRAWRANWLHSPRKDKMDRMDDTFPFTKYHKRQDALSRAHASLLMQVRSGHLPLNFYLHRIRKAESKRCQACSLEQGDNTPTETIQHFLYDCEAYANQRKSLLRSIGASNIALREIMLHTKRMKALAQYITRTKRFENTNPQPWPPRA